MGLGERIRKYEKVGKYFLCVNVRPPLLSSGSLERERESWRASCSRTACGSFVMLAKEA